MNKNLLVIFNICELKYNNLFQYIDSLDKLLAQNYDPFRIVISGCGVTGATKQGLKKRYGNKIWYNYMDESLNLPFTFNKTVTEVVKQAGEFDGYVYIDSGINTKEHTNVLSEINNRAMTDKYGMITIQTDDDMGYDWWFDVPKNTIFRENDLIIPVGKCVNLHFQYYDRVLREYFERLIPDIFAAYCIESIYSFFNASVSKQWCVVKDMVVEHVKAMDGAGVSIKDHIGPKGAANNLNAGLDIHDIIFTPEADAVGLGYNEAGPKLNMLYKMHDPSKFTSEGHSIDPKRLAAYLKKTMYLTKEQFDYDSIQFDLTI